MPVLMFLKIFDIVAYKIIKLEHNMYNEVNRRMVILLAASSVVGISGCMTTSTLNLSQSVLIRNETTTEQIIDLILKTEGEKFDVVYESTFTVDPNEQIREGDVVSASDYTYTVESGWCGL
ncbi:hypothetical protein G3I44_08080 [Halogeometricum borinquense]|uniref:Uncharacterized protein n=1 Tax=Halogeometricum borinquense TaxID=60847 RepID=A0A6C0UFL9_9EURY|nr:hypothetical protein [Halogeometricum borinquense]QIB74252.1 hypothetical protein G3I44_08080 [Halogeometricum borinquense]